MVLEVTESFARTSVPLNIVMIIMKGEGESSDEDALGMLAAIPAIGLLLSSPTWQATMELFSMLY